MLTESGIVVEVKMPRKGLADKKLGEELLIDIAKYSAGEDFKTLVIFVFYPGHLIQNPIAIIRDLEAKSSDQLKVLVSFQPAP